MNGTDILKVIKDQLAVAFPKLELSPTCYDPDKLEQKIHIYGMDRMERPDELGALYKRFIITVEDRGMLPIKKTSEEWLKDIPAEFKEAHNNWKGERRQTDDILVAGFKV